LELTSLYYLVRQAISVPWSSFLTSGSAVLLQLPGAGESVGLRFMEMAFEKIEILGDVSYSNYQYVPGMIDSFVWVDNLNWTNVRVFPPETNLSKYSSKGVTSWTLV